MSTAAVKTSTTQAAQSKPWTWLQTLVVLVAIFFGTGYVISKMHKPQPIKEAVASLIKTIPFLAPLLAPLLLDDGLPDPGPCLSEGYHCPQCEIKPDGSATALINGESVPALNHEFGS